MPYGMCRLDCAQNAHIFKDGQHLLDRNLCIACGKCAQSCAHGARIFYGQDVTAEEIKPRLLEDLLFFGENGGVTLSGGEPLMRVDFCVELLQMLKKEGIHTVVDTCGMVARSAYERVLPWTDQFLFDVKAADPALHEKLTGSRNEQIIENLQFLNESKARIEIRIPLIPGKNDGKIPEIGNILCPLQRVEKVKVLGFHNLAAEKYASLDMLHPMGNMPSADTEQIRHAVKVLRQMGLPAVC